ncbi:MAG: hypothetical protein AB1894_27605 [Chloroflexota bacterium]
MLRKLFQAKLILIVLLVLLWWWLRRPAQEAPQPAHAIEILIPDEKEPEPAAKPVASPAPPDDLKRISGIGPKIAGVLQAAGVTRFQQLAGMDGEHIGQILQAANVRLAKPESWPEQAQLAAAGDWDGLAKLQAEIKSR